jgi:hypothetical protein
VEKNPVKTQKRSAKESKIENGECLEDAHDAEMSERGGGMRQKEKR